MGRKGKKKTKKQLEDELSKAAEHQCRLEEQERLKKVEEDCAAAHRKRLDWELDSRQRVEEAERLEEESSIVARMKGERQQNLEYEQQKLEDQLNWKKFVSCNSRPNVAFENEITAYMTMAREDSVPKLPDVMQKCHESEDIVGDLIELYCKAREFGDIDRQRWCRHYMNQIRALEIELIDDATADFLQYIEKVEANLHSSISKEWGQVDDDVKVGFWGHLQSKGFRAKNIDFIKLHISLELPKSIATQAMGHAPGVRVIYSSYDSVEEKDPSNMPVGGTLRVDLLSIPPFSRKVKGWTIRQIPPPGQELLKLPYPNTEHTQATSAVGVQPVNITYKIPAKVLVSTNPTISWWDTFLETWSTDGITDINWNPDDRKVSFCSQRLASFSITQDRHLDLPYEYWVLRPLEERMCKLTLKACRYELHFVITEEGLRLQGPNIPELKDIMFDGTGLQRTPRVRSPATLLLELRDCGLNLMPEDGDAEFLPGYTPKNPSTEARAYSDLSELAGSWDICSSVHNKSLPADRFGPGCDRALLRIRENTLFEEYDCLDPDCDVDYQAVMFFPDKACFVQSLEGKTPCIETPLPGHLTHASLFLAFEKHPNPTPLLPEQLERMRVTCTNVRFFEAVRQTMALMRLLSFS